MEPLASSFKAQPRFLKMLPNEDFDSEMYEDEKDWNVDEDSDFGSMPQQTQIVEKRGADLDSASNVEESVVKKGRLNDGASLDMVLHVA